MLLEKDISVQLVKSMIGRPKGQKATLYCLKLNKLNKIVTLKYSLSNRGMINKVIHLVKVSS